MKNRKPINIDELNKCAAFIAAAYEKMELYSTASYRLQYSTLQIMFCKIPELDYPTGREGEDRLVIQFAHYTQKRDVTLLTSTARGPEFMKPDAVTRVNVLLCLCKLALNEFSHYTKASAPKDNALESEYWHRLSLEWKKDHEDRNKPVKERKPRVRKMTTVSEEPAKVA